MAAKKKKSQKQSSGNQSPDPLFFLDESLGRTTIVNALRELGEQVIPHHERFSAGTLDKDWLTEAGTNDWVVLTKDKRIRYRSAELRALQESNVAAFILSYGNMSGDQMAKIIKTALPEIKKFLKKQRKPFIATITKNGNIRKLK